MELTQYHAKYFAYELTKRSSSDSVQKLVTSLMDAQVDLNPHQVEAALFAFRSPLSSGAILADEVGLGKTIEAGLVISQKWAERKRKILIITPANLRKQWSQELADKFYIQASILETKSFNDEIKKSNFNPFCKDNQAVICSYQFARKQEHYINAVQWDLVVIDEAHRLRNVYKPNNKIANAIKSAISGRPKILLTATPLQNSLLELYGLVSIIDDYTFGDIISFKSQYNKVTNEDVFAELKARLKPICIRTLRKQVLEYIRYTNRVPLTQEFYPTDEEQKLYDLVSDYLQGDKLYALPQSQRQLMTLILRRLLASSTYAISGTLKALAKKLDDLIFKQVDDIDTFENSVTENYEQFPELKDEWEDEEEGNIKIYSPQEVAEIKTESEKLKQFHLLAQSIQKNSKGEVLLTALKRGLQEAEKNGSKRKAIIFTESTRTQKYLFDLLGETEFSGKLVLFNGSNNDHLSKEIYKNWLFRHKNTDKISGSASADIRAALIDFFKEEAEIMIATEAAAEGVNLQFCSLVVNYDLPWNPQRIEQRIGRCHRYGQRFDVVVVNFLNKSNAADLRVYELLAEKFKLFEGVFGASDEILGAIEGGVDFEKRIVEIYQTCRTEEEINAAFDELQKTFESQIDENIGKTKQKLLENFDQEVIEKLRISLTESRDYITKYENWLWQITKFRLAQYASFNEKDLSFYLNSNPFGDEIINSGPYKIGKDVQDENVYRIGHPLAQKIIEECKNVKTGKQTLILDYSNSESKISILEPLLGKRGWLSIYVFTISAFESEDFIIINGITSLNEILEEEQCKRLFGIKASVSDCFDSIPEELSQTMREAADRKKNQIIDSVSMRNSSFFEDEINKLDKWGEDKRNSLKVILKELDDEIRDLKKQSRLAPNLPEKLQIEKERKKVETKRDDAWREYDNSAKEIETLKDKLIDEIELKMNQKINYAELFEINWQLV